MNEQEIRFFDRARISLFNPVEVTENLAKQALSEAILEIKNKAIAEHQIFDIAMVRLKILLKIEVSEEDWKLYDEAKKAAAMLSEDGEVIPLGTIVGQKESMWDI